MVSDPICLGTIHSANNEGSLRRRRRRQPGGGADDRGGRARSARRFGEIERAPPRNLADAATRSMHAHAVAGAGADATFGVRPGAHASAAAGAPVLSDRGRALRAACRPRRRCGAAPLSRRGSVDSGRSGAGHAPAARAADTITVYWRGDRSAPLAERHRRQTTAARTHDDTWSRAARPRRREMAPARS